MYFVENRSNRPAFRKHSRIVSPSQLNNSEVIRMNSLQLLRGVGCILIVIAHCVAYSEAAYNFPLGTLDYPLRYGMLSCANLFLSLSGFSLTAEIYRSCNLIDFLKKVCAHFSRLLAGNRFGCYFAVNFLANSTC